MKTERTSRDVRLDAVRGLLLILMAGVHVPTPVSHFLQEPLGFMSEAEGFIFLSACLAGFAYGRTYCQSDWRTMARRVWIRTRKIYCIHLTIVLPMVLFAWMLAHRLTPLANHFHDFLVQPCSALALIPLLLHQPPLFDILPLYIVLLGVTPWLLAIARRHGWGIVLAFSLLGWLAVQIIPGVHPVGNAFLRPPFHLGSFNVLSWQLVWVTGLAFGETSLRRPLLNGRWRAIAGVVSFLVVLAGLLARHGFLAFNPGWFLWMDKWTLGPLRLLNFAAWVGLLLVWNPKMPAHPLAPLALLGRNSLAVFYFHLPLVVIASTWVQSVPLSSAGQVVVGLSVIALLFPWAAWLEHKSQPARTSASGLTPSHLLPIRTRIRSMELFHEIPVRPMFSRARLSARNVA